MITKCLSCGKIFDVEVAWKGQEATCDSCGKDFLVKKYIECPKCSQLTPENGENCESCNSPITIPLKRPPLLKSALTMPASKQKSQSVKSNSDKVASDPISIPKKHSQTIDYDADKIALESVSGVMRFWIRLAAAFIFVFTIISVTMLGLTGGFTGDSKLIVLFAVSIPILFIFLMGAKMMSDAANAKAKIAYTMFHKIIFAAFCPIYVLFFIAVFVNGTGDTMPIRAIKVGFILFYAYMYFVSWRLYRARAFAQAEITD